MVGVDSSIAGKVSGSSQYGFIMETDSSQRRNPILEQEATEMQASSLGVQTTFGFRNATKSSVSFINEDNQMPKGDSITLGTTSQFAVGSLATWKNQWIREHCWRRNIAYAYNEDIGYNFMYTFDFSSMLDQLDDIGAVCYPNFRIKVTDGFNPTSIQADLQSIISEGKFYFMIDNTYTSDTFKIAAEFKSDLFLFSEASDYSDYLYGLRGTVGVSGGSNQPYYQQVVPLNSAPYYDDDVPVRMSVE